MTDVTEAAGRLRRAGDFDDPAEFEEVVYAGEHYGPYEDQCLLADAIGKELDPTLIDETFAEQIAISRNDLPWSVLTHWIVGGGLSIQKDHAVFRLAYNGHPLIDNPTIGQFWTAVRLFGVKVKGA